MDIQKLSEETNLKIENLKSQIDILEEELPLFPITLLKLGVFLLSAVVAGSCSVFVRLANGRSYWSVQTFSVSWAQEAYATGGDPLYGGYSVTGYCCASCSNYQNHPSYEAFYNPSPQGYA